MAGTLRPGTLRRTDKPSQTGGLSASSGGSLPSSSSVSTEFNSVTGGKKLLPPNRKQHEADLKDLSDKIAFKEREIAVKKQQFATEAAGNSARRVSLPEEIKEASERLRISSDALKTKNEEIQKKHDEVNQLRPRMTYRSESQIDDTINRLEYRRTHQNFTLPEEQKIIREIDKLRRSKNELRNYNRVVGDRKIMENSLKELRDSRQACYIGMQKLISEEKVLKETERRQWETVDGMSREVHELIHRRNQLLRDFDHRLTEWETQQTAFKRWKHCMDQQQLRNSTRNADGASHEVMVHDPYAAAKQTVSTLLTYLLPYVPPDESASTLPPPPLHPQPPQLPTPLASLQDSLPSLPLRSCTPPPPSTDETPGYFLPKKHSDVTTPTRTGGGMSKAKKERRKVKTIPHSAAVVAQFASLDLLPPPNTSEVHAMIDLLKAKKAELEKQTMARLASMATPKTSPTEEALPPLPGPSMADVVAAVLRTEKGEVMPAITVTSVASLDEPDRSAASGATYDASSGGATCCVSDSVTTHSEVPTSVPPTDPHTTTSTPAEGVFLSEEGENVTGSSVIDTALPVMIVTTQEDRPTPRLRHSFTMESGSEDLSTTTSLTESTAENSAEEEEEEEEEEGKGVVVVPVRSLSRPVVNVQLNCATADSRQHLHPEIFATNAFPETPPIDEAFMKPVFSSVDSDRRVEEEGDGDATARTAE